MKIEDINPDEVDEISSIKIDRRKSSNEIILNFLTQVKNPYVFKVNGKLVRMSFAEMDHQQIIVLHNVWKIYIDKINIIIAR